jgi:spermidine synthase
VLIPAIGTQRTFLVTAAIVSSSACFVLGVRYLAFGVVVAALLAVPPGVVKPQAGVIHEETSRYQYIQVVQRSDGRRLLYLNEGVAVHSVWRPHAVLTGGEWDTYLALPPLLGRPLRRVAILGNAGGTTARALGVYYPRAAVDGVELDPAVTRVGRRYFGLGDNPRLTVHTADARPYLRAAKARYDLVVVDAYHQPYVPFYLATREFFRLAKDRLAPGGILALNVAATPDDKRLVTSISGTLATEFPQVLAWPALHFNTIVLGLTQPVTRSALVHRLRTGPRRLAPLRRLLAQEATPVAPASDPWTDDRAPVEWVTDRMIVSFAAHGGRLEGPPLPTMPRSGR